MKLRNLFTEAGDAIARTIVNYYNVGDSEGVSRIFNMLNNEDQNAVIDAYEIDRLRDWRVLRSLMA